MDNAQPPYPPERPVTQLPKGSWDAHVHLLGGPQHPLSPNRVENPPKDIDFDGWLNLYRDHLAHLGCDHGLIVHSILYGTDNSVTLEAVNALGAQFKGVGLLPDDSSLTAVQTLANANICAVRLNYVHGGVLTWEGARKMAPMLADHNMHIQMLLHVDLHILEIADDIRALPTPLVIDHCGWPMSMETESPAINALCDLLSEGHVWIKLSAPYRFAVDTKYAHPIMRRLLDANPDQCIWGSDWQHIMLNSVRMPRASALLDSVAAITSDQERTKVFKTNPDRLFAS